MRPYITVSKIPNFDETRLPYWDIYEREGTAKTIMAGGTMAGQFTAGLSGGQRKMLLFELIVQRTANQSELLIVLDEPFAGKWGKCQQRHRFATLCHWKVHIFCAQLLTFHIFPPSSRRYRRLYVLRKFIFC